MVTLRSDLDLDKFISALHLESGSHQPDSTFCVMEAVAYVAGETWTDSPACASPAIAALMRNLNDYVDDATRQRLKPYIVRLVGSVGNFEVEAKRALLAADWAVRVATPRALRLAGLESEAIKLEALPVIDSRRAAATARRAAETARRAAETAGWAAETAGWAAETAGWAAETARGAADMLLPLVDQLLEVA